MKIYFSNYCGLRCMYLTYKYRLQQLINTNFSIILSKNNNIQYR
jgi:hypothetical protein